MEPDHLRVTYNDIHKVILGASYDIAEKFKPNMLIAIGWFPFTPNSRFTLILIQVAGVFCLLLPLLFLQ